MSKQLFVQYRVIFFFLLLTETIVIQQPMLVRFQIHQYSIVKKKKNKQKSYGFR